MSTEKKEGIVEGESRLPLCSQSKEKQVNSQMKIVRGNINLNNITKVSLSANFRYLAVLFGIYYLLHKLLCFSISRMCFIETCRSETVFTHILWKSLW